MGQCASNDLQKKAFNSARNINLTLSYDSIKQLKSDKVSTTFEVEDKASRQKAVMRSIHTYDSTHHALAETRERTFYCQKEIMKNPMPHLPLFLDVSAMRVPIEVVEQDLS